MWTEPASYTQVHVILKAELERISLLLVLANTSSLTVFSGHWWAAADGGHFPGRDNIEDNYQTQFQGLWYYKPLFPFSFTACGKYGPFNSLLDFLLVQHLCLQRF